jgi:hypothetical protein
MNRGEFSKFLYTFETQLGEGAPKKLGFATFVKKKLEKKH